MQPKKYPGLSGRSVTVQVGENVQVSKTATFGSGVVLNEGVVIGPQSQIGAGCKLWHTTIGKQCVIGEGAQIRNCTIGDKVTIGTGFSLGRYYSQPATSIANEVVIGNSVSVEGVVIIGEGVTVADETEIEFPSAWDGALVIGQKTRIGSRCRIEVFQLGDIAEIGDGVTLFGAHIESGVVIGVGAKVFGRTKIGASTNIGPNCAIHEDVRVGAWCKIGGDVTIRRTVIVPNHWEIPDSTVVNPGPDSAPIVIHKTVPRA